MKKHILLLFSLFSTVAGFSQLRLVAEGPVFPELEGGVGKVLLLKDGTTAYLAGEKNSYELRIYGKDYKEQFVQQLKLDVPKSTSLEMLFENGGELVLMANALYDKHNALVRIRINLSNGEILEQKELMELPRARGGAALGIGIGALASPDFTVRVDAETDHYAIAKFNTLESDRNKRLEIVHYGPGHKEIGRAFYQSPQQRFKYMHFVDILVMGKEQVFSLVYAYNTKASGGKEYELLWGSFSAGKKDIEMKKISGGQELGLAGGLLKYNPVTKKILLMANIMSEERKGYIPLLLFLDAVTGKIENEGLAYPGNADEMDKELFGKKSSFRGLPQNVYINGDGSFSILFEEISNYQSERSYYSVLGNAAVVYFDMFGTAMGTYFIPKSHTHNATHVPAFYLANREREFTPFYQGNQFRTLAYLDGTNQSYLLINDVEENVEAWKKGKVQGIRSVGGSKAYQFQLASKQGVPDRSPLFADTGEKRFHQLTVMGINDFDRKRNVFVTLKLEKDRREAGVRVVWFQP